MEIRSDALTIGSALKGEAYTYKIEKVLGQGSFGITYLATTHVKTKTVIEGPLGNFETEALQEVKVAVKEFFMRDFNSRSKGSTLVEGSSGKMTSDYRRKFRREALLLSKLSHPNIVKVLEVFDANNTTYYSMQFVEGCSLNDYIEQKGKLDEQEALQLITPVAEALKYLHSQKMLHLDLKPKNIMLDNANIPYLIDFGLSKQFDENGEPESSTNVGLGTPGYAPLEQASYKHGESFPATLDIYALGATLYKMLTGKTPPDASSVFNNGLPSLPSSVSVKTRHIIEQAMQPRKKDRPQTMDGFIALLHGSGFYDSSSSQIDDEATEMDAAEASRTYYKVDPEPAPRSASQQAHAHQAPKATSVNSQPMKWKMMGAVGASLVLVILLYVIFGHSSEKSEINDQDSLSVVDYVKIDSLLKTEVRIREVQNIFFKSGIGDCSYSGPVDDEGKPNGRGVSTFSDGRRYEGNFEHGVMSGNATFKYGNGDIFEGTFANNGFKEGKYTIKSDGSYFQGTFRNGKPDKGDWYDKNGKKI